MNVCGFSMWKPVGSSLSTTGNLKGSKEPFVVFLSAFPDLEKEFFSGNPIWIKPNKEHFDFLEKQTKILLEIVEKDSSWKHEWTQEKIDFIKRGGQIVNVTFQGKDYEINTFGRSENRVAIDTLELYDTFKANEGGIKVIPNQGHLPRR